MPGHKASKEDKDWLEREYFHTVVNTKIYARMIYNTNLLTMTVYKMQNGGCDRLDNLENMKKLLKRQIHLLPRFFNVTGSRSD